MTRNTPTITFQPTIKNLKRLKPRRKKLAHGELTRKINTALDFFPKHAGQTPATN